MPMVVGLVVAGAVILSSGRSIWFVSVLATVIAVAVIGGLLLLIDRQRRANQRTLSAIRRLSDGLQALDRRVSIVDSVAADAVRRAWEPSPMPWTETGDHERRVLLLPGAAFHLPEIVELAHSLDARGIPARLATGDRHWERLAAGLVWESVQIHRLPTDDELRSEVLAVVTMKDWAGYGEVVKSAQQFGIPTFAKVEGAQDFDDVDTGYARHAYRQADHVLCQGVNDYEALEQTSRFIVGSTRLERLWQSPALAATSRLALINLNFTYGVMTEARELWLESAIAGCEKSGFEPLVAVHPAETHGSSRAGYTAIPISRILPRAAVLISRFSTVPFEAMARGVAFVYHNPHSEQVATFADAMGAFPTSESVSDLSVALSDIELDRDANRETAEKFFRRQVDIAPTTTSGERAAAVVSSIVEGTSDLR